MDAIALYLKDMARIPRISIDEERLLVQQMRAGDRSARERLISANLRLAVNLARKFKAAVVPLEDRIQAANLGLLRAADRYDPNRLGREGKPIRFSTYATWWIKNFLNVECWLLRSIVRIPQTAHRIYEQLDDKTRQILATVAIGDELSEETIADRWDPWEELGQAEYRGVLATRINRGLDKLSQRSRYIVRRRMEGDTLETIGDWIGLSKERVRQIEVKSFQELRDWFAMEEAA